MNKIKEFFKKSFSNSKESFGTKSFKLGSFSLVETAIVLAILIVFNIFAEALPQNLTHLDISSQKLYSISSNTKAVLSKLTDDVTIYWICQSGEEDDVLEKLLSKYEAQCDYVTVEKKNPDVYPTFTSQYTDDDSQNNDLIVECGDKYRYISVDDIYEYDLTEYYYSGTYDAYFDGEGEITSAIDYVVREELPTVYMLTGHGEATLDDDIQGEIDKLNVETVTYALASGEEVPEDADMVFIYAPASDISEPEKEMLTEYINDGGKVFVVSGPVQDGDLVNLNALLSEFGIESESGLLVEQDTSYCAFGYQYILMPDVNSVDFTDSLIEDGYYSILYIARGFLTAESYDDDLQITEFLTTSPYAINKAAGYNLTSYELEDGDKSGTFAVGIDSYNTSTDGRLTVIGTSDLLDATMNSYSSGANLELALNIITAMTGESDAISIHSKSLNYEYLTISDSQATTIRMVLLVIIPVFFLTYGAWLIISRKRKCK